MLTGRRRMIQLCPLLRRDEGIQCGQDWCPHCSQDLTNEIAEHIKQNIPNDPHFTTIIIGKARSYSEGMDQAKEAISKLLAEGITGYVFVELQPPKRTDYWKALIKELPGKKGGRQAITHLHCVLAGRHNQLPKAFPGPYAVKQTAIGTELWFKSSPIEQNIERIVDYSRKRSDILRFNWVNKADVVQAMFWLGKWNGHPAARPLPTHIAECEVDGPHAQVFVGGD